MPIKNSGIILDWLSPGQELLAMSLYNFSDWSRVPGPVLRRPHIWPLKEVCNVIMPLCYITFTFLNQDQILWSAGVLNWSFYVHQADRDVHSNNWVCRSKSKYCRFSFSDWVGCPSGAISQIGSQSAADLTCSPHNALSETNTMVLGFWLEWEDLL